MTSVSSLAISEFTTLAARRYERPTLSTVLGDGVGGVGARTYIAGMSTPPRSSSRGRRAPVGGSTSVRTAVDGQEVEIRRSTRRTRTVSAYHDGDRVVVLVPARLSGAEEARLVQDMVGKVARRSRRQLSSDDDLIQAARRLSTGYLGGMARPSSVRWVDNQRTRWGSCTPSHGTIRLSSRLVGMPDHVQDYVLLHELAHLLRADHSSAFWDLLQGYPDLERARAFLDGVSFGAGLPAPEDDLT